MRRTCEGIGGMTVDREKKIAEIQKSAEEARKTKGTWVDGQDYADDVEFLLNELERLEREYAEERAAHNAHVTELCELGKENRKLLEERDEARSKAEEAWKEIDSLEEQLLSSQQEIERLREERNKLIEGLRMCLFNHGCWREEDYVAYIRDLLKEIGVTVE